MSVPTRSLHTVKVRKHPRARWAAVGATLAVVASTLLAGTPSAWATTHAAAACPSSMTPGPSRVGRFAGIVHPLRTSSGCSSSDIGSGAEAPYGGTPPLLNHGGPVMSTQATGDKVVVTPIFWEPTGNAFTAGYKATITQYLTDLAHDSGRLNNVFSSLYQYSGSNGAINYKMHLGSPISVTAGLPADGCTVESSDSTNVYADSSGYSHCLDDAQVVAETNAVVAAHSLPSGLGHLYVIFLPKHVESCFNPGATNTSANACTLNHQPSAAYCAYHSMTSGGTVYANMPFPAYQSGTGYSCTKESLGGGIQSPNGNTDADVEISPLSHEMAEAITDPDVTTGWYDSSGNENGDDCAYIYGTLSGSSGTHYNQTINANHYLTQEEFSNEDFVANASGCVQGIQAVTPTVTSLSSSSGPPGGGGHVTITGSGFAGATTVHFGATTATFSVLDRTHIDATVPAGTGTVDVGVTTAAGSSLNSALDQYTYGTAQAPTVTGVTPGSGPTAGAKRVTISGTSFTAGSTVSIGGQAATSVSVVSATRITATTPAHAAGTVDVRVTADGGPSSVSTADHYTYRARPSVTKIAPTSGPHAGGTKVTITGSGFVAGAVVRFAKARGLKVKVVSPTKITVKTPKHAKGKVDVTVTTAGGTSKTKKADRYTYT